MGLGKNNIRPSDAAVILWSLSMPDSINFVERRQIARFKVKNSFYAAILKPACNKLGPIKDINNKGLSFQYISDAEQSNGVIEVVIFSSAKSFYLKLPAIIVVDFLVNNPISFSSIPTRQLNVKFVNMNKGQKMLLDFFVQRYAH